MVSTKYNSEDLHYGAISFWDLTLHEQLCDVGVFLRL